MSTPNTSSDVVADLWSRVIERAEGAPRSEAPTEFSTQAAWDRVITLVNGDDPTTVGRPLGPVVGPARQEEWWR